MAKLGERQLLFILRMKDKMSAVLKRNSKEVDKLARRANVAQKTIKRTSKQMDLASRAGSRLRGVLVTVFAGFTAFTAISTMAQFGDRMSTVQAVSQATGAEFVILRDKALKMGETTRFTASQAASGMEQLARAGFNVNQTLAAIKPSLDLASSGALDLGTSADIMTNVMSSFGLEASRATDVADVLAFTAANSNTDVRQLGDAFVYAGGTANQFGVDVNQTAAAFAVLANQGRKASVAGSGINTMIALIAKGGKPLETALGRIGQTSASLMNVMQSDGPDGGLIGALKMLQKAGVDSAEGMRIFGTRAGPTFNALAAALPQLEEFNKSLGDSGGTAARLAFIMEDNLGGSLRRLQAAWQSMILSLNQDQDGIFRGVIESTALMMRYLAGGEDALSDIRETIGHLGWDVEATVEKLKKFKEILKFVAVLAAVSAAVYAFNVAIGATALILGVLTSPITLTIAALTGLTLWFLKIKDKTVEFGGEARRTASVMDIIVAAFNRVVETVKLMWSIKKAIFTRDVNASKQWVDKNSENIEKLKKGFRAFVNFLIALSLTGPKIILGMAQTIGKIMTTMGDEIVGVFTGLGIAIKAVANRDFVTAALAMQAAAFNSGKVAAAGVSGFEDTVKSVGDNFKRDYVGVIGSAVQTGVAFIKDKTAPVVDKILDDAADRYDARMSALAKRKREAELAASLSGADTKVPVNAPTSPEFTDSKSSEAAQRAAEKMQDVINKINAETQAVGQSAQVRETYNQAASAGVAIAQVETVLRDKMGDKYQDLTRLRLEDIDAMNLDAETRRQLVGALEISSAIEAKLAAQAQQRALDMQAETDTMYQLMEIQGLSTAQREVETAVIEAQNAAKQKGLELSYAEEQAIRANIAASQELAARQSSTIAGMSVRWDGYKAKVTGVASTMKNQFRSAIGSLTDGFAKWFTGQKVNWRQMAADIVRSIAMIIIKMLALMAVMALMEAIVPGSSRLLVATADVASAKGNAFVNTVQSGGAKLFPIAGGQVGSLAEKGPEAILPLTRTSNGELGVQAIGGSAKASGGNVFAPQISVVVNPTGDEDQDLEAGRQMAEMVEVVVDTKFQEYMELQQRREQGI